MSVPQDEEQERISQYYPSNEEIGEALFSTESLGRQYSRIAEDEEQGDLSQTREHHQDATDESSGNSLGKSKSKDGEKEGKPEQAGGHSGPGGEKVGLLHPSLSDYRTKILFEHLKIWLMLGCLIIASFSVYWGALYNRTGNLHRLKMLVIVEDSTVDGIDPLIGDEISTLLGTEEFKKLGTWEIVSGTDAINEKLNNPENVTAAIIERVHHKDYWSAVQVLPNATYNQYQLFQGNIDETPLAVQFIYESGRDITTIKPYVVTTLQQLQSSFQLSYGSNVASQLVSKLSESEKLDLINNTTAIATAPGFRYFDHRPYSDNTLLAPLQVGLIYLIIISFFLFNFFAGVHQILIPFVHTYQYLIYRIVCTHLSYLVLSLFISAVSAIFQINFQVEFGKAGFVIYWFSTYLTMAAVGGANENMALLIFTHNPPFLGFWLISFVILNVSPSFSPLALISPFYRYGYMMPIHHSSEISKVIFLGLYKGQLGLNYGIIIVWIVLNTLLLPLILKHVGGVMGKRAAAAKAAAAAGGK